MSTSTVVRGGFALFAAALMVIAPQRLEGQDANRTYSLEEVTTPPRVKSDNAAAQAINRSYPDGMRDVGGRVQLRFVVNPDGRVDGNTIEVMVATATVLGEAATRAIQQIEFQPAQVNGVAVRTQVVFPITYAAR